VTLPIRPLQRRKGKPMPEKMKVMVELEVEIDDTWTELSEANDDEIEIEENLQIDLEIAIATLNKEASILNECFRIRQATYNLMEITATADISDHEAEWEAADALEKKRMDDELKLTKGEVG